MSFDLDSVFPDHLINDRLGLAKFTIVDGDDEIATGTQRYVRCAFERQVDGVRSRAGIDDEVVLEPLLITVINRIDTGIDIVDDDALVCRDVSDPLLRVAAV